MAVDQSRQGLAIGKSSKWSIERAVGTQDQITNAVPTARR